MIAMIIVVLAVLAAATATIIACERRLWVLLPFALALVAAAVHSLLPLLDVPP